MKKKAASMLFKKKWPQGILVLVVLLFTSASAFTIKGLTSVSKEYRTITPVQENEQRSLKLFREVTKVLRHARCINCHPSDNFPRQGDGDETHRHLMNVQRGPEDRGMLGMQCTNCHQSSNNEASGVPGAPEPDNPDLSRWHLAPLSMGWMGLTDAELGARLLDKEQNGGMNPEDLVEHMKDDPLVLWGWNPGSDREPIPISHDDFIKILEEWVATGAHVPEQ